MDHREESAAPALKLWVVLSRAFASIEARVKADVARHGLTPAEQLPDLELRVLRRDENLDLMDAHLSGTSRAIPVVIVLDEHFEELGWWGARPGALQAWFSSPEAQAMEKTDRYREMRRWYARDGGRTALEEIAALLETTAVGEDGGGDVALVA